MPKPAWIAVIAVTFIGGAVAWLIAREPVRTPAMRSTPMSRWDVGDGVELAWASGRGLDDESYLDGQHWTEADDAVARHPAGRARTGDETRVPKGPDDDPDFLLALDRVIRRSFEAGE